MSSNRERPDQYIGVSGVVSPAQQDEIESFAELLNLDRSYIRLALGVKAVHKTQFLDVTNSYGTEWYPVGEVPFANALRQRDEDGLSMGIAQTYFDPEHVDNPGYRTYFSDRIFRRGERWIDGIQFDLLPWHEKPEMLSFLTQLKAKYGKKILLQCHNDAMEALGPRVAARRLEEYADVVDYVLFDASHGTGARLNTDALLPFLDEVYAKPELETTGFAIAGGLDAEVVEASLPTVLAEFPDISWDAEGRLHPINERNVRPLDMGMVRDYLKMSRDVLERS
jgi:hypothetical protein